MRHKSRKKYYIKFFFILFISQICFGSNFLKNVSFNGKENGLIIEFIFDAPVPPEDINAWQSNTKWFYFTIYNVSTDTSRLLEQTQTNSPVLNFQPILNKQSTQIGIKLKDRVETFEIFKTNKENTLSAHLHYSLEKFPELASVSNYKKKERKFNDKFSRSKSWLLFIGSGYTITGLMNKDDKLNNELKFGVGTLFITYLIHKIWPM